MILANTEELHEKNDLLSARIRELEDALRTMQMSSEQPHPLLRDDILKAPIMGHSDTQPKAGLVGLKTDNDDVTDAFGAFAV
jgi:hypothetical protein